jgi:hypothetical protein
MKSRGLMTVVGLAALIAATSSAAGATTFDFKYTFDTGQVITGSFTGTESGGSVTNLANISASLNGVPFVGSGNLYAYSYTAGGLPNCGTCFVLGGAVASFNPLNNNFLFADSPDVLTGNEQNYFYVIPWTNPGPGSTVEAAQYYNPNTGYIDYYNGNYITGNWSLTAVPELSTWAMMLFGFAGMGVGLRAARRKQAVATA